MLISHATKMAAMQKRWSDEAAAMKQAANVN